jgi:uncharacterized protein (DUF1501 family)
MDRRSFLGQALKYAGAGAMAWSGAGLPTALAAPGERVLVVVFMRGGWDGLNVSVPYGDDTYYSLRPTLAIRPPSDGSATSALDLDGFFGFHPSLSALHTMYQAGQVAVLPAVHYPGASNSHFMGQDILESAVTPSGTTGWLARHLMQSTGNVTNKVLSLTDQVPLSLAGLPTPVSAFPDLGSLYMASSQSDRTMLANVVTQGYSGTPQAGNPYAAALHGIGGKLLGELAALQQVGQMTPENGAAYPSTSFGRQMRQAAALVKGRAGLELITLNLGGWDTHSAQGGGQADGRMSMLLSGFSNSVSAFFTDLGAAASRVTLLTVTEFGRTAAENGSQGTDHGNASTWMAIGPNVRGGVHLGAGWPGLQPSQLLGGRALAHSIDFRAVYANVLTRCLGTTNLSAVLPGYSGAMVDVVA